MKQSTTGAKISAVNIAACSLDMIWTVPNSILHRPRSTPYTVPRTVIRRVYYAKCDSPLVGALPRLPYHAYHVGTIVDAKVRLLIFGVTATTLQGRDSVATSSMHTLQYLLYLDVL